MFKNPIKVMPKSWPAGVAGAVVVSLILGLFTGMAWPSLIVSAMLAGIAAFGSIFFLARHDARLTARFKDDAPFAWDVWMNGIKIGLITYAQYAAIQRYAFGDGRLVIAQALNLGRVALNIAGKVFVGVPLLMFWLLVVASIATPEAITEFAQAWRTANLADLTDSLRGLFHLVAMVSVMTVGVMCAIGYRFGFRNHYGEAVARMIRQQCNTPTEGEIHLSKVTRDAASLEGATPAV